jgi:hypothetical protein
MGDRTEERFRLNCDPKHSLDNAGGRFHRAGTPEASTRAAVVLSAVGCDWREGL